MLFNLWELPRDGHERRKVRWCSAAIWLKLSSTTISWHLSEPSEKNKRELPPQFANVRDRSERTSMFGFSPTTTIVSYIPKKHKNVILVSTMHHDAKIESDTVDKTKPHIVTFYNSTKGGVDTADELCETYSMTRKSCHWPLTVFISMLNIAGVNTQIIYHANTCNTDRQRLFLKQLALELISYHTFRRMNNPRVSQAIRSSTCWLQFVV